MKGQAFIEFTLTVIFVLLLLLLAALVLFTFGVIASHYFLVNYTLNKFVGHPRLYQAFREQKADTRFNLIEQALTEALNAGNSLANWLFGSLLKTGRVVGVRDGQAVINIEDAKISLLLPPNYFIDPVELKFIIYQNQEPEHTYTYANYFETVNPEDLHLYPVIAVARASFPPPLSWIGVDFTVVNQKVPKFLRELTGVRGQATYDATNNPQTPTNQGGGTSQTPTPTPTPTPCPIRAIQGISCEVYVRTPNTQGNLVATFCPGADNLAPCVRGCMCVNDDD
jgi:hypothetical protein